MQRQGHRAPDLRWRGHLHFRELNCRRPAQASKPRGPGGATKKTSSHGVTSPDRSRPGSSRPAQTGRNTRPSPAPYKPCGSWGRSPPPRSWWLASSRHFTSELRCRHHVQIARLRRIHRLRRLTQAGQQVRSVSSRARPGDPTGDHETLPFEDQVDQTGLDRVPDESLPFRSHRHGRHPPQGRP